MTRIESIANRAVPDTDGPFRPLSASPETQPALCFMVFAAAFTVAVAVAHALGPSNAAEAAAYRYGVSGLDELTGTDLIHARREAIAL
jgi:hypothetical protein